MSSSTDPAGPSSGERLARAASVIVVSSVMFTFISYWRTAAVVLCDMSSTAFYIGGIVEQAVGAAAPWFILAVLLFSSIVRLVYVESCSLFVRGGVYRVVKAAMGGTLGKLAVSALMFDYILTGPISSVSAGQYVLSLGLELLGLVIPGVRELDPLTRTSIRNWGSVAIAVAITLYFFRQNLLGIHESSGKALKIMGITTVMGVIIIGWCLLTMAVKGPANEMRFAPELNKKYVQVEGQGLQPKANPVTGEHEDPLGFLGRLLPQRASDALRQPGSWLSLIGLLGLFLAFGHSILAMSGEETLAQVYREVESPKLQNFKKAALVVFVYSLALTGSISFLAVLLIPDADRMRLYSDNLIGGLAMNVIGPHWAQLVLNALVVVVGFLILSGAVNTSIIGSNGVLSRMAEDGVLTDWFLKPQRRYGTNYRLLALIVGLQLLTIVVSGGNMFLLGEAYAFGVVWSFVFQALAMLVLRFTDPRPREFKVPGNLRIGKLELPLGLAFTFLVLAITAVMNFFTKEVATVAGLIFTGGFMTVFTLSERYHHRRRQGAAHEHLEQFNRETTDLPTRASLGLTKPFCKLVAIRSPHNLFMLEKALAETDPAITDVAVMTAKLVPADGAADESAELDRYDQRLMTAVVDRAELAGKGVIPLIMPTNNPLYAVLRTAKDLEANELVIGASNKFSAEEQLDNIALYWVSLHGGKSTPLTVRILSENRDVSFDFEGGSRIPKLSDRLARSVAEVRAAGVGVDRVLLAHDGTVRGSDLFQAVLTMLDPAVALAVVTVPPADPTAIEEQHYVDRDLEQAIRWGRHVEFHRIGEEFGASIVRLARDQKHDLIILPAADHGTVSSSSRSDWIRYVLSHAHCQVLLASPPVVPTDVEEE
jgi:amino acid transporter/nucleotide-binding universal stress UspA family protein